MLIKIYFKLSLQRKQSSASAMPAQTKVKFPGSQYFNDMKSESHDRET